MTPKLRAEPSWRATASRRDLGQVDALAADRELAPVHPREVEEVLHEPLEPPRLDEDRPGRVVDREGALGEPLGVARIAVRGVFSSWLTERRKLRSLSREAASCSAISLNDRASNSSSAGPVSGTASARPSAASACVASATRPTGPRNRSREQE
jgi:hypothetical protein